MKRRMRNRTYGVVGGNGRYPVTYPMISQSIKQAALYFRKAKVGPLLQ